MDGTAPIFFHPSGTATGIGSLPYTDPLTALALIGEHLPEIPHWPQLPQRVSREHFCHQFLKPLVDSGLLCENADRRYLDASPQHIAEGLTPFMNGRWVSRPEWINAPITLLRSIVIVDTLPLINT